MTMSQARLADKFPKLSHDKISAPGIISKKLIALGESQNTIWLSPRAGA